MQATPLFIRMLHLMCMKNHSYKLFREDLRLFILNHSTLPTWWLESELLL